MNGGADALIRAAAADVAGHRIVDVLIGGLRFLRQQGRRRHDLSGLAIPTLRDVELEPRFLHRMRMIRGEPLDRGDFLIADGAYRRDTGAGGLAVEVYRACTTQGHAAAVLG